MAKNNLNAESLFDLSQATSERKKSIPLHYKGKVYVILSLLTTSGTICSFIIFFDRIQITCNINRC